MKHIYVTRHGQTDWNLVPKVQGITDIPLNETGINQAKEIAEKIKIDGTHFDKILCSPLSRALETARIISEVNDIPYEIENRLIEQNFGKWEGFANNNKNDNSFTEAKQCFFINYENGESMARLCQRVYNLLDELKVFPEDKNILLVTHGGIARCIHSYFNEISNEEFSLYQMKNCELIRYEF